MNKKIVINKNTPKRINFKISKKRNKNVSNNKISLKYLLSNNSDSKKRLSLLLNKDTEHSKPINKIVVNKHNESKNNSYHDEYKNHKQHGGNKAVNFDNQQKVMTNNLNSKQLESPKSKVSIDIKKVIEKEVKSEIKKSIINNNTIQNKEVQQIKSRAYQNNTLTSPRINKLENKTNHDIQDGGDGNKSPSAVKIELPKKEIITKRKNIVNNRSKKEKIISLDIKKKSIQQDVKRNNFINKINSLSHSNIKKILIKNNLIRPNSRAPKNLMRNILINTVDLGVNLI